MMKCRQNGIHARANSRAFLVSSGRIRFDRVAVDESKDDGQSRS